MRQMLLLRQLLISHKGEAVSLSVRGHKLLPFN